jgi:hypothetical protein
MLLLQELNLPNFDTSQSIYNNYRWEKDNFCFGVWRLQVVSVISGCARYNLDNSVPDIFLLPPPFPQTPPMRGRRTTFSL